jgi:predicted RND superfamily exporter protein
VDLGVAISGAVILGIAVDDTMHFLVKYFGARGRGLGRAAAFDEVMEHAGQAIMVTTLILSAAFTMLVTSDFIPNAHFAVVTATALLIAVAVDLLFLPALLSLTDRKRGQGQLRRAGQFRGLQGPGFCPSSASM